MRVLGVIPARGGSRRIPNKNIATLADRPLIAYTCEAARESGVFDEIYVNTDAPLIREIARQYGVACPVLRPAALARDDTSTELAMRYFLSFLAEHGETYDVVIVLQPTSPLRSAEDIRAALTLYEQNAPCAVVSVASVAPATWLGRARKDGQFEPFAGDDPIYRLNGAVYVYPFDYYLHEQPVPRRLMLPMPAERSIDIDTPEDWRIAEALLARHSAALLYDPV